MLAKKRGLCPFFAENACFASDRMEFCLTKMVQRITVSCALESQSDPMVFSLRRIPPSRKDALHLKAVCSNPRQKREKFVALLQHTRLNELHLAQFWQRAYGRATNLRDCTIRKAEALSPRTVSPGESIRSISNGP
jgi:hypothetical protein